ncbi:MAG TPA: nuclear transport factor 2 family protein, partial [Bryobacteraceae bacterium]
TRLSEDWMRAVWDKDEASLNRLMTDDFVLVSPAGSNKLVRGPEWLRGVRSAGSGACEYSNVHVQSIGNETAIMAAELSCKGDFHGIGMASKSVVSDVWVRRGNGGWRVAARIASTSPRFTGFWMPLLIGAAIPLAAWAWAASRARARERNSLMRSANSF